jgi:L-rhamnose-H+ transport protein
LAGNYFFAILAGVIGYNEFFWYGMGTTKMGRYDFSSWSIHLAFVIIFSSIWGLFFREWKGIGRHTRWILWGGLAMLLFSTVIIGAGNCLSALYPAEYAAKTPADSTVVATNN